MSRSNFKDWIVEEEKSHIAAHNQKVKDKLDAQKQNRGKVDGKGQS